MKIYFAGSIRGGRDDKDTYMKLIDHLKKYGTVLTEHIGDESLADIGEKDLTDEYIYLRDVSWIEQADVIIAEVSTPSLGVGYEIGISEKLGKRILCIYRAQEGKRLSAMLAGSKNITVKIYNELNDAIDVIDNYFMSF